MSYSLNNWEDVPKTASTEVLGVDRSKNHADLDDGERLANEFQKARRNTCLLVISLILVVVLLITSVVLCIFLVKEININGKTNTEQKQLSKNVKNDEREQDQYCYSPECLQIAANFAQNMDTSLDPCENFYLHSCAAWMKNNPIPPARNMYDVFMELDDKNSRKLRDILEEVDELPEQSAVKKAKRYFESCVNEDEVERVTNTSIKPLIAKYGSWALDNETWNSTQWKWTTVLLTMARDSSITPLIEVFMDTNPRNSSQYMLSIYPPSLSLIREKYLTPENKTRLAYLRYMTKVGKLLGGGNTTNQQMADVLELEGKLANIIPPRSEINNNFHRDMNITELEHKAPGFGFTWLGFINDLLKPFKVGVKAEDRVIVPSPEYLRNLSYVVNSTDNRTLSNYMMWTFVRSVVPYLSRDFRSALLEYQKEAEGTKTARPRWLSCVEDMNDYFHGLTFALGYMWVSKVFDAEVIPLIQEMMTTIKRTFREETSRYDWIDDQTRQKIIEKENAMKNKIGFPKLCSNETLLNEYYKDVNISRNNYLMNALDVMSWRTRSAFSKLKDPVDKEQWFVGPQLVNAFYLPNRNEINILAGILQPPFYYGRKAPRAVNFGAIGMVLAHELSHGFDASGRYFNKDGEIIDDWWSKSTSEAFEKRSKCIVDQYSNYSVDGGEDGKIYIDGELTLSENIADNGGIRLAYWGYKDWIKNNGPEALLPGLNKTNDQLLFVSFAQMWCSAFTPSSAYYLAKTDTHALANYRVIGTLSNMKEFSEAFNCPAGRGMNPEKKCKVW